MFAKSNNVALEALKMLALLLANWKAVGAFLLVLGGLGLAYGKGHHDANLACEAAELRVQIALKDEQIARLKTEQAETAAQAADELADAKAREKATAEYVESLKAEQGLADATEIALEADLAKMAKTKEEADVLIDRLRKSRRMDCRASDRDAAADRGVFRH